MAIVSSIKQTAFSNSAPGGKKSTDKEAFQKYLHGDQAYKAAYDAYLADEGKLAGPAAYDYKEWKKTQNLKGNPIDDKEAMLKYTKLYYPEYLADVTEYYASFNPSTPKTTKGQTYVPEAWKPKPVEGIAPPNMNTNASNYNDMDQYYADLVAGKTDSGNTSTDTTTDYVSKAEYDELLKMYEELLSAASTESHGMYKDTMSSAQRKNDWFEDFLREYGVDIMKEAMANPLETDWGKGILDYYGVLGENSANAVNAATAAENSGNIDSYAAANAERQRVAKLGQGIQSVMGMSTERFNNMIAGLNSIGVNTDFLLDAQGDLVGNARQYATDLYNIDADSTAKYNQLLADIESGSNPYVKLDEEQVMAALKQAYMAASGDTDASTVDWANTDDEIWAEALKDLEKDDYIKQLAPTYLKTLRNKIKGQTTK